jgi:hypothetical protein
MDGSEQQRQYWLLMRPDIAAGTNTGIEDGMAQHSWKAPQ